MYTDEAGNYEDTLLLDQDYVYNLLVDEGEWMITARRLGDTNHENAQASTNLKIEPRPVTLFSPIFMVGAIVIIGFIAYFPPAKKMKNKKTRWRLTLLLSCAGLILGAISLTLNWMAVAGTAVTNNTDYQVDIAVRPFQEGIVSINEGLQYVGVIVPSMVHLSWQNLIGSIGPVLTLYLAVAGYALALIGLYKPKTSRQRRLKAAILVISGILAAATVVHAFIFAYGQANAITGASIGFGMGIYLAVISSALLIFSGVSATREIPRETVEHKMLQQRGRDTIAPNASAS